MTFPDFSGRWPHPTFDRAIRRWTFAAPASEPEFDSHRSRFTKASPEMVEQIRHRQWLAEFEAFRTDAIAAGHSVALTAHHVPAGSMPGPSTSDLVYGVVNGSLVVMERFKALETAAFKRARTWGEFRRGAPVLYLWATGLLEGDDDLHNWRSPADECPMYPTEIPGYDEGDFPDGPGRLMLDLIPKPLQEEYGQIRQTELSGPMLWLDPHREPEILAALRDEGFLCLKDGGLIEGAFAADVQLPHHVVVHKR